MFNFSLTLNQSKKDPVITKRIIQEISDDENDSIYILTMCLCTFFAKFNTFKFSLSGFGTDLWPIKETVDLSNFLEVGPNLLQWIENGYKEESVLDFCSQTLSMSILLTEKNDFIHLNIDRSNWAPGFLHDSMKKNDFESSFFEVNKIFYNYSVLVFPQIKELNCYPTIVDLCKGNVNR